MSRLPACLPHGVPDCPTCLEEAEAVVDAVLKERDQPNKRKWAEWRDHDRTAERRYETWLEDCKDHGP